MGFLDIPAPVFTAVDGWLAFLPETLRLILWATLGAAGSMYLYLRLSRQDDIGEIKRESVAARKALNSYEGSEFGEMLPLATRVLALSGKHFMIVLLPAVLSSLPALTLIVWVSNQFGAVAPVPGSVVAVVTTPPTTITWSAPAVPEGEGRYNINWPADGETLTAYNANDQIVFTLGDGIAPLIHQKTWWNLLIANPAGYLPDSSALEFVEIKLGMKQFLPFGPDWLRDWAGLFFIVLLVVSIAIKVIFKID